MATPEVGRPSGRPDIADGDACIACASAETEPVLDIPGIPVLCNLLAKTREEALQAPRGDFALGYCRSCGHLFNSRFDPARLIYSEGYETSLHFSGKFQSYVEDLAERLIGRYGIRGKTVVEIGCGEAEFLALLCEKGNNRGIGFDTSYAGEEGAAREHPDFTIIRDYYKSERGDYDAALVCCRHVLEHVASPRELADTVRAGFGGGRGAIVYFEVPNARYTLEDLGIWDLIYEHCSYFSLESLTRLFHASGFEILAAAESYGGQFLGIEATARATDSGHRPENTGESLEELSELVRSFAQRYRQKFAEWQGRLGEMAERGERTAIWGAGSKGITFLNALGPDERTIDLVDISPRKQGKYVPGTGHRILRPDELQSRQPDTVILMNPVYHEEVATQLATLGLDAEIVCA